ncbi:MAG: metalloregulator ArsR/SmtB family transcription factor [Brevundimonas sp.]|uniref:ArsR/SmtB family transcription factor n=1 Tax=Brevundimonas sp. TaxID=1871086 RepID=UPI0024875032|nr:metalloregulator ArsR/SmtB family transcription factor [Brevundimonas sp.]MDI1326128.1 metalloregulator ArsR/SmtB family transcription factor [Brevundimonas sp.]
MTVPEIIEPDRFEASAGEAARLLRALSNDRRLMILCQLGDREMSVGQLLPLVGLSQSALSQHLAKLREEALVATRRDGTTIFYRVAEPAVLKVIAVLAEVYCPPLPSRKA